MARLTYKEIQDDVVNKYRIILCDGSKCNNDWSRMHAHVTRRTVCKWKQKSSVTATFDLLHEIGHIETRTSKMRRCEEEYAATRWAISEAAKYWISVPDSIIIGYQEYIDDEHDRGVRRGGNLPPLEQFQLVV